MRTIIALALIAGGGWQMWAVLANKVPAWEANILGGKAVGTAGSGQSGSGGSSGGGSSGSANPGSSNFQGTSGTPPGQGIR